jgi:hypothetical protein
VRLPALLASALLTSLVIVPAQPAAEASIDPQACANKPERLRDAEAFALDVCFNGTTLFVRNRTDIPLHVGADGAGTPYQRPITSPPPISLAYVFTHPAETNLLMPGYQLEFPVGDAAVNVRLAQTDHGRGYVVLRTLSTLLPDETIIGLPDKVVTMVNELVNVYDQHIVCLADKGPIGDIGCEALYYRNVLFAIGRQGIGLGGSAVKDAAALVLGLFSLAKWANDSTGDAVAIQQHGTFSIAAAPTPPAPAPAPQPDPVPAPDPAPALPPPAPASPPPAPNPPPPPVPRASNLVVVIYGGGHVGVAFDVGWQSGRDPVTCHFLIDGAPAFTAQCGTHASKQFYGVTPGDHTFSAYVTDREGARSVTLGPVTRRVT